jgi:hypothetical protein
MAQTRSVERWARCRKLIRARHVLAACQQQPCRCQVAPLDSLALQRGLHTASTAQVAPSTPSAGLCLRGAGDCVRG